MLIQTVNEADTRSLFCFEVWLTINHSYIVTTGSDFIWDFRKLPFPSHLGKYFIKIGKISVKIHKIGKIKAIFILGMTPI